MLGKTLLSKKAHKKTHVHTGQGKDGAALSLGEQWLL
jgi:hypothetical protein